MSANRFQKHLHVLPEDDANRQIANGFVLALAPARAMQVLPPARGGLKVLDQFERTHAKSMRDRPLRYMILLIDLDGQLKKLREAQKRIPPDLANRVFALGVLTEPEELKIGSYESIGGALAQDCRDGTDTTWNHELLKHNAPEVARLSESVRPILFP